MWTHVVLCGIMFNIFRTITTSSVVHCGCTDRKKIDPGRDSKPDAVFPSRLSYGYGFYDLKFHYETFAFLILLFTFCVFWCVLKKSLYEGQKLKMEFRAWKTAICTLSLREIGRGLSTKHGSEIIALKRYLCRKLYKKLEFEKICLVCVVHFILPIQ